MALDGTLFVEREIPYMVFNSFDGRLLMPLHQANYSDQERLHLFEGKYTGETLELMGELE